MGSALRQVQLRRIRQGQGSREETGHRLQPGAAGCAGFIMIICIPVTRARDPAGHISTLEDEGWHQESRWKWESRGKHPQFHSQYCRN